VRIDLGGVLDRMSLDVVESLWEVMVRAGTNAFGIHLTTDRSDEAFEALLHRCRALGRCLVEAPGLNERECRRLSHGVTVLSDQTPTKRINYSLDASFMKLRATRGA